MKLIPESKLSEAFKSSVLAALISYTYHEWLIKNDHATRYTYEHKQQSWTQVYTLLEIAAGCDSYYNSSDAYLAYRDELLAACAQYFSGTEVISKESKATFDQFIKWMCKGTSFTDTIILKRMHISQYAYDLKERGIWKAEYSFFKDV